MLILLMLNMFIGLFLSIYSSNVYIYNSLIKYMYKVNMYIYIYDYELDYLNLPRIHVYIVYSIYTVFY